jgi:hypothetical protein
MTKHEAIFALYPNVVTIRDNDAFDANENAVVYDEQTVANKIASMVYSSQRQSEYPSFADQFDTIFHDGLDAWKAQIQAVKDKYPKGE